MTVADKALRTTLRAFEYGKKRMTRHIFPLRPGLPGFAATLVVILLGTTTATACTGQSTPAPAGPTVAHDNSASASGSPAPTVRSSASAGVQNLVVSASVRSELTAAYEAFMRFKPSGIAGTAPNSVYYARDAAAGTYWAMATFVPTAAALHSSPGSPLFNELVDMQDGGNQGMFTRTSGGAWQVQRAGVPPQCQIVKFFPNAVITAWALNLPRCPAAD